MANKPSIPKGTRDFSPQEMMRRNYIFDTIKEVFKKYGYQPIETPAMENLSTLLGKYGDEGDRLLFKILNSGDFLKKTRSADFDDLSRLALKISEKGLRYDLTVPFARYVVQNQHDISFPFKRYQIQPVWRADKPQKGRYREFFQCDVDVIGSRSMLNEVELIQIIDEVFGKLGVACEIKLNNRKILAGIAEVIGEKDKITEITVAIDKLDKIGLEKVNQELQDKGVSREAIERLQPILMLEGLLKEKFPKLMEILKDSETGMKGLNELMSVMHHLKDLNLNTKWNLDLTLARGLDYYTGAIIEVVAKDVKIGSICGGGRYDDLTGIFGLPDVSGVGISFGADRIYDVMMEKELFPEETEASTQVMFVNFGDEEAKYCLPLVSQLREAGIPTELFPDAAKMKKQMNYANKNNIPYVILVGSEEMKSGELSLKNMKSGEQQKISANSLTGFFMNK
ncbi:MAG: histidine--tRNA ligase [Bacteroidales bacterium]|nr:histidine--tRNA ligase [Bacteroidales bacterium]MCF8397352.1 histidine--tRNA ligase [Bacteroidales bacterium]